MDKKRLNNEIILCRPAVRKAKVIVIRKILKKMKILKSCKIDDVKEKKLKKSERLFEKVKMIKSIKPDEVTKFALRNNNLNTLLKGPVLDLKQNVLSSLAQHNAVMKQINSIRNQIPNWETELPILLDSLGRKIKNKSNKKKEVAMNEHKAVGSDVKKKDCTPRIKETVIKSIKSHKKKLDSRSNSEEKFEQSETEAVGNHTYTSDEMKKIEKVEDPFFIEKKVIAPNLLLKNSKGGTINKIKKSRNLFSEKETDYEEFGKPFKMKRDPSKLNYKTSMPGHQEEENLHPSWAAKKIKLIKPFEGKKIKFFD